MFAKVSASATRLKLDELQISFFWREGGNDCFSFSALSLSGMINVYKKRLHLILNLVCEPFFLIFTFRASFLRAICKNCRISVICFGIAAVRTPAPQVRVA